MDPDFIPIVDISQAESVANEWAESNGANNNRARLFALRWFESTQIKNRTPYVLRFMLSQFERDRATHLNTLKSHLDLLQPLEATWSLEVTKHLATFNGAGFAGAAAMLATKYADSPLVKVALAVFAAGFLLAILNMWLNSQGLGKLVTRTHKLQSAAKEATSWEEFHVEDEEPGLTADDWGDLAILFGWSSAVAGMVAASLLSIALI
ncbi:hypothetical protein [Achromobacter insolitus]|uniref:hypothetical protein n=1 Tax=Achromobacter insolitus TaxID=217204 RepID=UPI00241EC826|nr:hypothetical protein [Achromobacter insolitus]